MSTGEVACTFADLARFQARLGAFAGMEMMSPRFTDDGAVLALRFPSAATAEVAALVNDLSNGRVALKIV
jgi:putative IMPACT (imprinted ancient) family translation regulator